jgi:tyrosine-protein phosphatase SIW14
MNILRTQKALGVLAVSLALPVWSASRDVTNIPNFHQVNDRIFRSGQPSGESWPALAELGVKTVIDLRRPDEHSTAEEAQAVAAAGMKYINVPMKGVVAPPPEEMDKILVLLDSPDKVLVHCHRGADRTGAVIACYRIAHDRWQSQQALEEAKSLGMRWTQMGLKRFIMSFQPSHVPASTAPAEAGL